MLERVIKLNRSRIIHFRIIIIIFQLKIFVSCFENLPLSFIAQYSRLPPMERFQTNFKFNSNFYLS